MPRDSELCGSRPGPELLCSGPRSGSGSELLCSGSGCGPQLLCSGCSRSQLLCSGCPELLPAVLLPQDPLLQGSPGPLLQGSEGSLLQGSPRPLLQGPPQLRRGSHLLRSGCPELLRYLIAPRINRVMATA